MKRYSKAGHLKIVLGLTSSLGIPILPQVWLGISKTSNMIRDQRATGTEIHTLIFPSIQF